MYASGTDVVMLDGRLRHLQTVLGSDCGYGDARINCVHCAESVGKIAVAWGSDVVVFEPELLEDSSSSSNEVGLYVGPLRQRVGGGGRERGREREWGWR